jgi:hypothetical protein
MPSLCTHARAGGMALGVDSAAHAGALESSGRTVAVLAGGADVPYPPKQGAPAPPHRRAWVRRRRAPAGVRGDAVVLPRAQPHPPTPVAIGLPDTYAIRAVRGRPDRPDLPPIPVPRRYQGAPRLPNHHRAASGLLRTRRVTSTVLERSAGRAVEFPT